MTALIEPGTIVRYRGEYGQVVHLEGVGEGRSCVRFFSDPPMQQGVRNDRLKVVSVPLTLGENGSEVEDR